MFHPRLTLHEEHDGEYTLVAETDTPDACYTAGPVERLEGGKYPIPPDWFAVRLTLHRRDGVCADVVTTIRHHANDLPLKPGNTVVAFVALGADVLGWDRITVGERGDVMLSSPRFRVEVVERDRPDLTDEFCDGITIANTPFPQNATGEDDQRLAELGIVDSFQTRLHKRDMQAALKRHGWSIAQGDLVSGPGKTIKGSRGAIQKHAS